MLAHYFQIQFYFSKILKSQKFFFFLVFFFLKKYHLKYDSHDVLEQSAAPDGLWFSECAEAGCRLADSSDNEWGIPPWNLPFQLWASTGPAGTKWHMPSQFHNPNVMKWNQSIQRI